MFVAQITSFELIVNGPSIQKVIRLTQQPLTIGRSKNAMPDIEIDEAEAAPRHCVVQWNAEGPIQALRVVVSKGTPRTAIVAALRNIIDLVEASTHAAERGPSQLATLAKWLDS